MDHQTAEALRAFTQRYCAAWQQQRNSLPRSEELYGVPSPCVVDTQGEAVFWQPQPFSLAQNISAVERARILWYNSRFILIIPLSLPAT